MKERRCGRPNSSAALKQTTSGTRILNRTEVLPPVTRQYEQSNRLGVLGLDYEPLFTSTSTFFPRPPHACIRSFFRCFFPSAKTCHRGHINHYYNALRKTPLNAGKIIIVPNQHELLLYFCLERACPYPGQIGNVIPNFEKGIIGLISLSGNFVKL